MHIENLIYVGTLDKSLHSFIMTDWASQLAQW